MSQIDKHQSLKGLSWVPLSKGTDNGINTYLWRGT